jgi:hypothetical protein
MSSNGSLLDETTGRALLDAGLQSLYVNAVELYDDYERTYRLPFRRTVDNVVGFGRMAAGRCAVVVVVVDHRDDPTHLARLREHWMALGVDAVIGHELNNRGGTLAVEADVDPVWPEVAAAWSAIEAAAGTPACSVPFHRLFVAFDGRYHLCSSDWEKQVGMADVATASFRDVVAAKARHVATRAPICAGCSLDPTNQLAAAVRGHAEGRVSDEDRRRTLETQVLRTTFAHDWVRRQGATVPVVPPPAPTPDRRRRIPVRAV